MKQVKFTLLLVSMFTAVLYAQDEQETSSRLVLIENLAESNDPELKQMALEDLGEFLSASPGEGERKEALRILSFLALEGVTNITYEGLKPGVTSASIRAGAAESLGQYGDESSLPTLISIMHHDHDALPIGAAVTAASRLSPENWEGIVGAYGRILKNTRQVYINEALIQTVLTALGDLGQTYPDIFENQDLREGLDLTSQGYSGYNRATRKMALELIRTAELSE
ncbi:MAG: HEAT repeat domain-containing protein [Spirochaetales bacterium]|nr:HEAT repeat domain-containing protein [Spirochaetales bacterium]